MPKAFQPLPPSIISHGSPVDFEEACCPTEAGMKRPAAHEKDEKPPKTHKKNGKDKEEEEEDDEIVEPLPLTEEALQSHNKFLSEMSKHKDMSQTQFDKTLATLPSRTAERLWKAFEACRKETGVMDSTKKHLAAVASRKRLKDRITPQVNFFLK